MRNVVTSIRGLGKLFSPVCVEGGLPVVTLRYCGVCFIQVLRIITLTLMARSDWLRSIADCGSVATLFLFLFLYFLASGLLRILSFMDTI